MGCIRRAGEIARTMDQEAGKLARKLAVFFAFMIERKRESSVLRRMQQHLDEYSAAGDLKKLKRLQKEIESRIRETFTEKDKAELKKRWESDLDVSDEVALQQIASKGRISDDDEYALVLSFVDQHFDEPASRARVDQYNKLLASYHKR